MNLNSPLFFPNHVARSLEERALRRKVSTKQVLSDLGECIPAVRRSADPYEIETLVRPVAREVRDTDAQNNSTDVVMLPRHKHHSLLAQNRFGHVSFVANRKRRIERDASCLRERCHRLGCTAAVLSGHIVCAGCEDLRRSFNAIMRRPEEANQGTRSRPSAHGERVFVDRPVRRDAGRRSTTLWWLLSMADEHDERRSGHLRELGD
ncbi:MAG: hypothetical protein ABIS07_03940 [Dokdonella sp.]